MPTVATSSRSATPRTSASVAGHPAFAVGSRVRVGVCKGVRPRWHPGCVRAVNGDGTYCIAYDAGDVGEAVAPQYVKAQEPALPGGTDNGGAVGASANPGSRSKKRGESTVVTPVCHPSGQADASSSATCGSSAARGAQRLLKLLEPIDGASAPTHSTLKAISAEVRALPEHLLTEVSTKWYGYLLQSLQPLLVLPVVACRAAE